MGSQSPTPSPLISGPEGYSILPPGRHSYSFKEFVDIFVHGRVLDRSRRLEIINDFLWFHDRQLEIGLKVDGYWFDGSFVSGKVAPKDIDFVTLVDGPGSSIQGNPAYWLNPKDMFQHVPPPGRATTIQVDAYALVDVGPQGAVQAVEDYETMRTYWDSWWQRCRSTGNRHVKGYVEVINDGPFEV